MKHTGRVLTIKEVMENRSGKYEFIDFKEAVEEAGIKHCNFIDTYPQLENPLFSFKEGVRWQQERSYTEDEMIDFSEWVVCNFALHQKGEKYYALIGSVLWEDNKPTSLYSNKELFEQFKNRKKEIKL